MQRFIYMQVLVKEFLDVFKQIKIYDPLKPDSSYTFCFNLIYQVAAESE